MTLSTVISWVLGCVLLSLPLLIIYAIWKAISNSFDRKFEEARQRHRDSWEHKSAEAFGGSQFAMDFQGAQRRFNEEWKAAEADAQRWRESGHAGGLAAAAAMAAAAAEADFHVSPHEDPFAQDSFNANSDMPMANPATGLLMTDGGIDSGGNPLGVDLDHH